MELLTKVFGLKKSAPQAVADVQVISVPAADGFEHITVIRDTRLPLPVPRELDNYRKVLELDAIKNLRILYLVDLSTGERHIITSCSLGD
jgi:hypothetical protein